MPLQATSGAASYDGFGGGVPFVPTYIEDVFSTYLYTGNGSTQTITNGIDLSGKGGMTWIKSRSNARNHILFDTDRGATQRLFSNLTSAQSQDTQSLTSFNSNGFSVGSDSDSNASAWTYVSWTFRKQPKFFDVVTYTGNGSSVTTNHSLGAAPGVIIVKATSTSGLYWIVYHRSLSGQYLELNTTSAAITNASAFTSVTSTSFTVGNGLSSLNQNGETYVAYLFAHDAGGFGLTGSDNVISCGSFTTDGSGNATVSLGYEPQWLLRKRSSGEEDWVLLDVMRGFSQTQNNGLFPNLADAEAANPAVERPTATGFTVTGSSASSTYIYIAIRRGPMKTPTSGTSVFSPNTTSNDSSATTINFPLDMLIEFVRAGNANNSLMTARLVGNGLSNRTALTNGDFNSGTRFTNSSTAVTPDVYGSGVNVGLLSFRRAPGFFDVVCYTGNGVDNRDITHNLGVAPELLIVKNRSAAGGTDWPVYAAPIGATQNLYLNDPGNSFTSNNYWRDSTPTATTFRVGTNSYVNANTNTYVAYLFATCPGVSKVGGYTGSGTTKQIDCGFTGGARFVMIKRTDSNGDWYVWDSTRGIVAGNDPYLLMNSTAAEVTNTDYIDTYSAGFEISSTAPAAINANGGSFVFLAIA